MPLRCVRVVLLPWALNETRRLRCHCLVVVFHISRTRTMSCRQKKRDGHVGVCCDTGKTGKRGHGRYGAHLDRINVGAHNIAVQSVERLNADFLG